MPNRLAGATSPYLLQHAGNPVDWYPWGEEALARARAEDRPILLSVGYSACHWCHVMARESFEDPEVARVMNAHFVNVKVDREERPDLDQVYQTAHALLTRRSGGWPLTMFLTPAGAPYFGGTYFPKEGRYGLPGFLDLLPRVAAAYRERGEAIAEQNRRLADAMRGLEPEPGDGALPVEAPALLLAGLKRTFDPVHGGFGGAPKFPHPFELEACLAAWARHGDGEALGIVRTTLSRMLEGGIHDQLGGGFCRYSVDAEWTIPHFEKMLYDNGPLLALYADLARATGEASFVAAARGIAGWLVREMRAGDGAFFSSLDADSEHEEGRFYVWDRDEVRALLPPDEFAVLASHLSLDGPANFEGRAWNLRVEVALPRVAADLGIEADVARERLDRAKRRLFEARARRVRPARDDKILTAWNALAVAGLARASRALDDGAMADLAFEALDALRSTAWRDGRLYATRKDGPARLPAYLDDYAFLLAALVEAMQTRLRSADFDWAHALARALLERFEDRERGGFWFTAHDHEPLFHRGKPGHDNATPSGNGVAARALAAFGHLAGEPRYVEAARRTVGLFAGALRESPGGHASLALACEELAAPPSFAVLAGERATCRAWQRALERRYRPWVRVIDAANADSVPAALVKGEVPAQGAAAWLCQGTACLPPVRSLEEIERLLDER